MILLSSITSIGPNLVLIGAFLGNGIDVCMYCIHTEFFFKLLKQQTKVTFSIAHFLKVILNYRYSVYS